MPALPILFRISPSRGAFVRAWIFPCAVLALTLAAAGPWGGTAWAHAKGDLDEFGGHFDERTGGYHYHRPVWDLARRTKDYLNWIEVGEVGELQGVVARVDRPDALWVEIPYRPAYQNLAAHVSKQNRDDQKARVKVWFRYISPERSALAQGREYSQWFKKKVVFELDRKLRGKPVTVQFWIDPASSRVKGMVLVKEENINLWLVLKGWSFYLIAEEENPYEPSFVEAEQVARAGRAGLWGRGR